MNIKRKCQIIVSIIIVVVVTFNLVFQEEHNVGKVPQSSNWKFYSTYSNECSHKSIADIIEFSKLNKFENGIPKVVHYVYKDSELPSQYLPLMQGCANINRDVLFLFWSDDTAHKFVLKYFPTYKDLYESYLKKGAEQLKRSDIIRYFLLVSIGGIYMDIDTKCQLSFEDHMGTSSCQISMEPETQTRVMWDLEFAAMNSFMTCVPNHRFFERVLSNLTYMDSSGVLFQTGPIFLTKIYKSYTTNGNETDKVLLAPTSLYGSILEPALDYRCHPPQGQWRVRGCARIEEAKRTNVKDNERATVVHMFYHLGYPDRAHLIKKRKQVCSLGNFVVIPKIL